MELIQYLSGVQDKNMYTENFPPTLVLPKDFAKALAKLYKDGEEQGCEFGQSASLSLNEPRSLQLSAVVSGTAISCSPPRSGAPTEYIDMHSHPSKSIGHVNGYSAHSLEDYFVFQHHSNKPLFIRLVASGPWFYAVVHRSGLTRFQPTGINELLNKHTQAMWEYFALMNRDKDYADFDKRREILGDIGLKKGEQAADQQMVSWKASTPGFGSWLMEKSIIYNTRLAEIDRYGFYSAQDSNTLALQAGPKGWDM